MWRNFKMINILWRKGLASFTQLVKVRRGKFFIIMVATPRRVQRYVFIGL